MGKVKGEECQVHGAPHRTANRALWFIILASFSLMIWHVMAYGPTARPGAGPAQGPFPVLLGKEIWTLLTDSHGIMAELWSVLPYFIAGILLAGYIRTYKLAVKLQKSFKRHGMLSVFLASVVGMITPLCACGTLTTAVSLLFARFPLAPVMALLVTSPLLSPSTYLLTLNDLGPEWTVIRTVAAFSMGMFAGGITLLLRDRGFQTNNIFLEGAVPRGDLHDEAYPDGRLRCNCKERFGNRVAAKTKNMFVVFLAKSAEMLWIVGKYVLVGVSVGAVVERYMPYEWIYRLFGRKDAFSIIWVTLGSVPVFLHQISASSIIYHIKSSLHGTLDGGAALAFMIGGPVTAMPTMVMFWTIFKRRVFFLYLFVCIAGTILISYAFQFLVFVPYADTGNPLLKGVRSISGGEASVINKENDLVRIVMDPGDNAMIATYNNDSAGQGGIVFDSSSGHFIDGPAGRYDNLKYVGNVAEWLAENNTSPVMGKRVLIYNTDTPIYSGDKFFGGDARAALSQKGFEIKITDRRRTPELSERLLGEYSQLWIFFGGKGPGSHFSVAEMDNISKFTADGKSMLVVAGGRAESGEASRLSSKYGVIFSGAVKNKDELPVSAASNFLDRTSGMLGTVLKFFHKA